MPLQEIPDMYKLFAATGRRMAVDGHPLHQKLVLVCSTIDGPTVCTTALAEIMQAHNNGMPHEGIIASSTR